MTTNNLQVEEIAKKIEQTCENACNTPATGMYANLDNKELNYPKLVSDLTDLFTHQQDLKDEQHVIELELAKLEAKIEEVQHLPYVTNLSGSDVYGYEKLFLDIRLSELNKQKELLKCQTK